MLLNLVNLISKYGMSIEGVIHIGAHYGEEYSTYKSLNIKNMIFFEPLESNFKELIKVVPANLCYKVALGRENKNVQMFVESDNQGQSSSILEPELHIIQYPHIKFSKTEDVQLTTLDSFNIPKSFNFINMDVQGYELEVLMGGLSTLSNIDYVMTEVNRADVYKNCARVQDLDALLLSYNFKRVETNWEGITWGDALYVKNSF